jgi:cell division protein FtsB
MKKQTIVRVVFAFEVMVFGWFYLYSANGFFAVKKLQQESALIEERIQITMCEIQALQTTIVAWKSDPFYIEQFAREHLQMAREQEIIIPL